MKYILVTMKLQNVAGHRMGYPGIYNAAEVELNKKGPIIYEGAFSRGENTEQCLICVQDALATKYVTGSGGLVKEVTDVEADAWLARNKQETDKPVEEITDQGRLIAIQTKTAVGQPLSQEDKDAVDPDNITKGINKRKTTVAEFYGV